MSAHQTEGVYGGGQRSDWYRFERTLGATADEAIDHWHRYDEDFTQAERMGLQSVRISLAWEKIEPFEGIYSREVLQHYRRVLQSMHRHHLRPMVALHHFVHPIWFAGWTSPNAARAFLRYAAAVEAALGDLCDLWITFNEPGVLVHLGYVKGTYPPLQRSWLKAVQAALSLARAHQWVTAYFHARGQRELGLVNSQQAYSGWAAPLVERLNWALIDLCMGDGPFRSDWLGVNYYGRIYLGSRQCQGEPVADNGWCLDPGAITDILEETAARYQVPVYIGENGVADANDRHRAWVLTETIRAAQRAHVDLRGYYHWSLLDNFEWNHGYAHKFGLLDAERRWRPSARTYRDLICSTRADCVPAPGQ